MIWVSHKAECVWQWCGLRLDSLGPLGSQAFAITFCTVIPISARSWLLFCLFTCVLFPNYCVRGIFYPYFNFICIYFVRLKYVFRIYKFFLNGYQTVQNVTGSSFHRYYTVYGYPHQRVVSGLWVFLFFTNKLPYDIQIAFSNLISLLLIRKYLYSFWVPDPAYTSSAL